MTVTGISACPRVLGWCTAALRLFPRELSMLSTSDVAFIDGGPAVAGDGWRGG